MMLGEMRLEGTMYRSGEPTLAGELSPARLAQAIASLPGDIFIRSERARAPPDMSPAAPTDIAAVKDGAFAERDGALVVRTGERFEPANLPESVAARVRGMLGVRDAVRRVFQTQLDDAPEDQIVEARRRLNAVYDSFVRRFGPVSSRENVKAFAGDPDQPLLLSLENYDPETETRRQDADFRAADAGALPAGRACRDGGRSARRLAQRDRRDPLAAHGAGDRAAPLGQLQRELGSLVYRNPEGGGWETADRYLSGNVRAKLAAARRRGGARSVVSAQYRSP